MTEQKDKVSISTVLVCLFAICFLIYISIPYFGIRHDLKALGILILTIPFIIGIIRAIGKKGNVTPWEQWAFILISLALFITQSIIGGRMSHWF